MLGNVLRAAKAVKSSHKRDRVCRVGDSYRGLSPGVSRITEPILLNPIIS